MAEALEGMVSVDEQQIIQNARSYYMRLGPDIPPEELENSHLGMALNYSNLSNPLRPKRFEVGFA